MATLEEVRTFFADAFPQSKAIIESVGSKRARVKQPVAERHLRPGGTVSGPVLMALADTATYAALLAEIGIVPLAVTSNLSIAFLRRPKPARDVVAEAELVKIGRRLAVADVRVYSEGESDPVAHASVTYAIPDGAVAHEPRVTRA
jgi:uncharacterized protein (TIGR00369 family)